MKIRLVCDKNVFCKALIINLLILGFKCYIQVSSKDKHKCYSNTTIQKFRVSFFNIIQQEHILALNLKLLNTFGNV